MVHPPALPPFVQDNVVGVPIIISVPSHFGFLLIISDLHIWILGGWWSLNFTTECKRRRRRQGHQEHYKEKEGGGWMTKMIGNGMIKRLKWGALE